MQNKITKCETLLQSLRQIYNLDNFFTFYKTKLHKQNTFTNDKINFHSRKQMYKMHNALQALRQIYKWWTLYQSQNKFTNNRISLERECTNTRSDTEVTEQAVISFVWQEDCTECVYGDQMIFA